MLWLIGQWRDALRILTVQVEDPGFLGGVSGLWARTLRAKMLNDLGLVEQARAILLEQLPGVLGTHEIQTIAPHLGQLARAYAALGDIEGLQSSTQSLMTVVDENPYLERDSIPALLAACRAWIHFPDSHALARANNWLPRIERAHQQLRSPETEASLHEAVGLLAMASGDPERAREPLESAAAAWESMGRPFDAARTLTDLGLALQGSGQSAHALQVLDRALQTLADLGQRLPDEAMRDAFSASAAVQRARQGRGA